MNGFLRQQGTENFFLFLGFFEILVHARICRLEFFQIKQRKLSRRFLLFLGVIQDRLENGVHEFLGVLGKRDRDADAALDAFSLFEQDFQNCLVHGIVFAIEHTGVNFAAGLTETVHAAFTLL